MSAELASRNPQVAAVIAILLSSLLFGLAVALGSSALIGTVDLLQATFQADLIERMKRLGMRTDHVAPLLRLRWALALGLFLVIWLVLGAMPLAVVVGILCFHGMALYLEYTLESYRIRLRDQIVVTGRNLAAQIRAGLPLVKALGAVAADLADPMGNVLRQMVKQCESGLPAKKALLDLKERLRLDGMSILVIALVVAEERGGNITQVLERIVHSLEETQRLERKKDSDTAAGRLLVRILTAFPIVFLGLFYMLDPDGTQLVFSLVEGQIVLGIVGLLTFASWRWAQSILAAVE